MTHPLDRCELVSVEARDEDLSKSAIATVWERTGFAGAGTDRLLEKYGQKWGENKEK